MRKQIADGHREIVIRIHQSRGGSNDSMPVGVRIVGECNAIFVFESDEPRHRIRARAIHTNHAVVIDRHERKRRVDRRVDDGNIQFVYIVDRLPVGPSGATERIDAQLESGGTNRLHVHDVSQILT